MLCLRIDQIQPKFSIFGHIDKGYEQVQENNIHFINPSVVNLQCQVINAPVVFDII